MECLSRIPYTSLLGFILVFIGAAINSATLYDSLNRTNDLFQIFFFKLANIRSVVFILISIVVVLLVLALCVLLFGFVVTGATRHKLYHRNRCLLGGRRTAAVMMFVLLCALLLWLFVVCANVVPVLLWAMFSSSCKLEIAYYSRHGHFRFTFSLANYGIYPERWGGTGDSSVRSDIRGIDEYKTFCRLVSTIGPLYSCSLIGSLLVTIGLVTLIASLASFYMRLKYTRQLTSLLIAYEDQKTNELDYIVNAKAM